MGESTKDPAQEGKGVEGGMERKPREGLWVIGQDDGPCRPEDNLNQGYSVNSDILNMVCLCMVTHQSRRLESDEVSN